MNVYELLCQEWLELFGGLDISEQDKIRAMLRVEDELQIRSHVRTPPLP